jgi:hypothetical protein
MKEKEGTMICMVMPDNHHWRMNTMAAGQPSAGALDPAREWDVGKGSGLPETVLIETAQLQGLMGR